MKREPNTIYILSLSYGKDSLACLEAIRILGLPLDRIVHAEVWATDTIPADLPPMVEFKKFADKIIKERYGVEVEHVCATKKTDRGGLRLSYETMFYTRLKKGKFIGSIKGFPNTKGSWCKKLKYENNAVDIRRYILQTKKKDTQYKGGEFKIYGFPMRRGNWCNNLLKTSVINLGVRRAQRAVLYRGTRKGAFQIARALRAI